MKSFLRTMLVVFGVVSVLVVSLILLTATGTISIDILKDIACYIMEYRVLKVVAAGILVIYGILSVISIAFSGTVSQDIKGGVILPLKVGEVHISTQTFESIVTNVAKKYNGIKTAKVNIKIRETGIAVDLFVYVLQDTVIADMTSKIQEDIKATILKQTTVEVGTVNVRVKGVYTLNENKEA